MLPTKPIDSTAVTIDENKQKTAYEMKDGLVGSEMCIRDRTNAEAWFNIALHPQKPEGSLGRTAQDLSLIHI